MEVEKRREDVQQPLMDSQEDDGGLHTKEMRNKTTDLLNLKAAAAEADTTAEEEHDTIVFLDPAKAEEAQPLKLIAAIHESNNIFPNWSSALDISDVSTSTSTTEVHETEVEKDENVTKGKASIEEYDLEKILDEQKTHELYCPNCNSCITRRVILKKRKRTPREAEPSEQPKRPQPQEPSANVSTPNPAESTEQQLPEVFRCSSCLTFFIRAGRGFNIFHMFGRVHVQPPPAAPRETSEHCGSGLLSCFPTIGSSNDAGSDKMPDETTPPVTPEPGQQPPHTLVRVRDEEPPVPPASPAHRDEWDILKAIVYGGLAESITSLSVVSAAAASGAKPLNIFVLGIGSLIGGLPVIYHNIADLRNTAGDVPESSSEHEGHYWMELGRRSKYRLHMVIAILSYILFGLLPPVIYGLSFRTSNNRENKMLVVAAASLVCIVLLAIGKAHVKRPRTYIPTILYYLSIGFSGSGLSYVAGVLITRLLAQFGLVDQGGPAALLFPQATGADAAAWASY